MHKVTHSTTDSFHEKGSKFIGHLVPVQNIEGFEQELSRLKSKYPDATHYCYAWRINPTDLEEFAQDDGEPGGTAGLPILNRLKSWEVVNAAVIVVRYYRGTNLGKSGLIEAYGRAAEGCLQKATLKPIQLVTKIEIRYPYSEQNSIDRLKYQFEMIELEAEYGEKVRLLLACPIKKRKHAIENLQKLKHRNIRSELLGRDFL